MRRKIWWGLVVGQKGYMGVNWVQGVVHMDRVVKDKRKYRM